MKPFKEVAETINKCKKEVFNYFLTPVKYTNAYTESINNIIKRIEKIGVGYSFEILRAKVLYTTNATKKPAYGECGFRVIDRFLGTNYITNYIKEYDYEGFGVDITTLLKIMDEGKFWYIFPLNPHWMLNTQIFLLMDRGWIHGQEKI